MINGYFSSCLEMMYITTSASRAYVSPCFRWNPRLQNVDCCYLLASLLGIGRGPTATITISLL